MNANRRRFAVVALTAVALTAVLTGCQKDGSTAGKGDAASGASASVTSSPGKSSGTSGTSGSSGATPGTAATATPGTAAGGGTSSGKADAKPAVSDETSAPAGCASEPPNPDDVDPDEIAVYRVEELPPSTGKVNLVIQHGAWGCPGKDTDGAPFVVTGEDSRWALDQAAYVTAVNPITETTENQRIGVQELIDWINAHPDSGLVFRYETGADGAIHRLEQVFMP